MASLASVTARGWNLHVLCFSDVGPGTAGPHPVSEDELRAATGLSMSDYHVMVVLSEADGRRLRMGELAGRLVFQPSRLTYQITSMVKRGLVRKQSCPDDGRGLTGRVSRVT